MGRAGRVQGGRVGLTPGGPLRNLFGVVAEEKAAPCVCCVRRRSLHPKGAKTRRNRPEKISNSLLFQSSVRDALPSR